MIEPSKLTVVVPTIGRPSLRALVDALTASSGPRPPIVVVDDRDRCGGPLDLPDAAGITVVRTGGRGPAAARNFGWRAASTDWVVFLDDDVLPTESWAADLLVDLAWLPGHIAGSQGRIEVPVRTGPERRDRPTDWARNTAGLEDARWPTADMAYRRAVLLEVGGFDEGFPRAYREDADLGLRVTAAGWGIARGRRRVRHPVRPVDRWISVRSQRGNADDARMRARHGRGWRARAGIRRGRFPAHAVTVGAATLAAFAAARRPKLAWTGGVVAAGLIGELAWRRIAPGPRTPREVGTMLVTTPLLAPTAVWYRLRGELSERWALQGTRGDSRGRSDWPTDAVLLDRDGTLVIDVPYNADPERVEPTRDARAALEKLRLSGIRLAVLTNQSGIARGVLTERDVHAVNRRIDELLGPIDAWFMCPHRPDDRCGCRKPAPGMVVAAARKLRTTPRHCVLIGDTGADVEAARRAGARAILVPNSVTRLEEIASAPEIAPDLHAAVEHVLASTGKRPR